MEDHIDQFGNVMFVEKVAEWNNTSENIFQLLKLNLGFKKYIDTEYRNAREGSALHLNSLQSTAEYAAQFIALHLNLNHLAAMNCSALYQTALKSITPSPAKFNTAEQCITT